MTTALTIVTRSLRLAQQLESGESPSTDEQADGLEALNDMLGGWSAKGWTVPYRVRDEDMAVASAANSYTIGTGGDLNTARPVRIDAVLIKTGGSRYPIPERSVGIYDAYLVDQEAIPEFFYYEPTYPLGTIYFPTKISVGVVITITSLKDFANFTTIDTAIELPAGFDDAIKFNLAKRLAPEYGHEVSYSVQEGAAEGLDFLLTQANAHRMYISTIDAGVRTTESQRARGYNVLSDR